MELFLKNNTPETFLIELLVDYLKLAQRNKVQIIHLSKVSITLLREP